MSYLCFRVAFYVQTIYGEPNKVTEQGNEVTRATWAVPIPCVSFRKLEKRRRSCGWRASICSTDLQDLPETNENLGLAVDVLFRFIRFVLHFPSAARLDDGNHRFGTAFGDLQDNSLWLVLLIFVADCQEVLTLFGEAECCIPASRFRDQSLRRRRSSPQSLASCVWSIGIVRT